MDYWGGGGAKGKLAPPLKLLPLPPPPSSYAYESLVLQLDATQKYMPGKRPIPFPRGNENSELLQDGLSKYSAQ